MRRADRGREHSAAVASGSPGRAVARTVEQASGQPDRAQPPRSRAKEEARLKLRHDLVELRALVGVEAPGAACALVQKLCEPAPLGSVEAQCVPAGEQRDVAHEEHPRNGHAFGDSFQGGCSETHVTRLAIVGPTPVRWHHGHPVSRNARECRKRSPERAVAVRPGPSAGTLGLGPTRRRGGVATQRPAKPSTPVRFRSSPLLAPNRRVCRGFSAKTTGNDWIVAT